LLAFFTKVDLQIDLNNIQQSLIASAGPFGLFEKFNNLTNYNNYRQSSATFDGCAGLFGL
jgi:hypothetical protein